jgi:hypothetical protein
MKRKSAIHVRGAASLTPSGADSSRNFAFVIEAFGSTSRSFMLA